MSELIIGLEAFEQRLKSLEATVQQALLVKAAKEGAELIRAEAERRAPRLKYSAHPRRYAGLLAHSQMLSVAEQTANEVVVRIGPSKDAFYGLFQELGTVHHPAQPFLLPAFEDRKMEALQIASELLKDEIEKR